MLIVLALCGAQSTSGELIWNLVSFSRLAPRIYIYPHDLMSGDARRLFTLVYHVMKTKQSVTCIIVHCILFSIMYYIVLILP